MKVNFKKILSLILVFAIVMALMPEARADERYFVGEYEMVKGAIDKSYHGVRLETHAGDDLLSQSGNVLSYTAYGNPGSSKYTYTRGIKTVKKFDFHNIHLGTFKVKYKGSTAGYSKVYVRLMSDAEPAEWEYRIEIELKPTDSMKYLTVDRWGDDIVLRIHSGSYNGEVLEERKFRVRKGSKYASQLEGGANLAFYYMTDDDASGTNNLFIYEIKCPGCDGSSGSSSSGSTSGGEGASENPNGSGNGSNPSGMTSQSGQLSPIEELAKVDCDTGYVSGYKFKHSDKYQFKRLVQVGDGVRMHVCNKTDRTENGSRMDAAEKISLKNKRLDFSYTMNIPRNGTVGIDSVAGIPNAIRFETSTSSTKELFRKVNNGERLYCTMEVNADGKTYLKKICSGNYYDKPGANTLYSKQGKYKGKMSHKGKFYFYWKITGNFYASFNGIADGDKAIENITESYITVHEINIRDLNSSDGSYKEGEKNKKKSSGSSGVIVRRITLEEALGKEAYKEYVQREKSREAESNISEHESNWSAEIKKYLSDPTSTNVFDWYVDKTGDNKLIGFRKYQESIYPQYDWSFIDKCVLDNFDIEDTSAGETDENKVLTETPIGTEIEKSVSTTDTPVVPSEVEDKPKVEVDKPEEAPYLEDGDAMTVSLNTASDWAVNEILGAMEEGLYTKSMMGGDFKLYATREDFSELVMKMFDSLGGRVNSDENPFRDTDNAEVIRAYNAGIINGISSDKFSPYDYLTREQLCVLLVRTLDAAGKSYDKNVSLQSFYEDAGQISPWAYDAVKVMNAYKIMNGSGSKLSPKDRLTKEMAILMLYRAYEKFK